tara:strand:+ start:983 stop:1405 length:423 start_codon:yes stop_codon:yes gene_type:complete
MSKYQSFLERSCEIGVSGRNISTDSEFKLNENQLTSHKTKCGKLLQARPYVTTPYMGSGKTCALYPNVESELKFSEITTVPKSINSLSGITIDRFTPLLPCIKDNVQDTKHLVPTQWVRGGADTRAVIRNIDYRKQCLKF